MEEQWKQWKPVQGLANKYYIDAVLDEHKGLIIWFSELYSREKKVCLTFKGSVQAYRLTDESYELALHDILGAKYGSAFYGKWTFFTIENSLYMKWLSEQSGGSREIYMCTHFSYLASNVVLDVIAHADPHIIFVDELIPHSA
jgi:hypothetical protein